MTRAFPGFSPKGLSFFRQLERNNDREWFTPRKDQYEQLLRGPMIELVASLLEELRTFAADHVLDPKRAVYRIYRDTRFSKDKTPYKTHIAALLGHRNLPRNAGANFYFHVSHKGIEVAGGTYMPEPSEQRAVRAAIAVRPGEFRKLVEAKDVKRLVGPIVGESYARVPKGFDAAHPAANYLRMKQWYFDTRLKPDVATSPRLRKEILTRWRVMAPTIHFLNAAALSALTDEDADDASAIPKRPAPMF
jgi:uncharacterized protein (TIGR02453 family)